MLWSYMIMKRKLATVVNSLKNLNSLNPMEIKPFFTLDSLTKIKSSAYVVIVHGCLVLFIGFFHQFLVHIRKKEIITQSCPRVVWGDTHNTSEQFLEKLLYDVMVRLIHRANEEIRRVSDCQAYNYVTKQNVHRARRTPICIDTVLIQIIQIKIISLLLVYKCTSSEVEVFSSKRF